MENDVITAGETITINIRDSFVPKSGTIFISADYSQLELRIMAHLAKYESVRVSVPHFLLSHRCRDEQLISILNTPNTDIFLKMASVWKKKPIEEISNLDRRQTKQICYGILYGQFPFSSLASLSSPFPLFFSFSPRFILSLRLFPS